MKAKPGIAILSIRNSYQYGGVLSCLQTVYRFAQQYFTPHVFFLGFDQDIATSVRHLRFSSSHKRLMYFGMECTVVGARWAFWEPGHYVYTSETWRQLLAPYDYVFAVSGTPIAAHPAVLLRKPFVLWAGTPYHDDREVRVGQLHGLHAYFDSRAQPAMHQIQQQILQRAGAVMAISNYAQHAFQTLAPSCASRLMLCPYPIQVPDTVAPMPRSGKIVLAVGRFSDPRKNVGMLLRVFDRLYQLDNDVRLIVVGKAPEPLELSAYQYLDSFKQVTFTGQLSPADLSRLYQEARVFLLTSYQEGLGIVGIEALAQGVPVVATDCGGTTDYVLPDQTGYLVPINDDRAMAYYARSILCDDVLATRLAQAGRLLVQQRYAQPAVHRVFESALVRTYPAVAGLMAHARVPIVPREHQAYRGRGLR